MDCPVCDSGEVYYFELEETYKQFKLEQNGNLVHPAVFISQEECPEQNSVKCVECETAFNYEKVDDRINIERKGWRDKNDW